MITNQLPIPPKSLLAAISGTTDEKWFLESGEKTVNEWERALKAAGYDIKDFDTIVDYGCGCGRALRHLSQRVEEKQQLIGLDTDARAVNWINENIPNVKAYALNDKPPCLAVADSSVNLVLSHSVFTHLPEDIQFQWLSELHRILTDEGIAVISFHGDKAIQNNYNRLMTENHETEARKFKTNIQVNGFHYDKGRSENEKEFVDYYGSTFHDISYIEEKWTKYFEIKVWFQAYALDYQDVLVLSKKQTYEHFFVPFDRNSKEWEIIKENEKTHAKEIMGLQHEIEKLDAEKHTILGELTGLYERFNEYRLLPLLRFSFKENIKHRRPGLFKFLKKLKRRKATDNREN